jgi:hypothetical protein
MSEQPDFAPDADDFEESEATRGLDAPAPTGDYRPPNQDGGQD